MTYGLFLHHLSRWWVQLRVEYSRSALSGQCLFCSNSLFLKRHGERGSNKTSQCSDRFCSWDAFQYIPTKSKRGDFGVVIKIIWSDMQQKRTLLWIPRYYIPRLSGGPVTALRSGIQTGYINIYGHWICPNLVIGMTIYIWCVHTHSWCIRLPLTEFLSQKYNQKK